MGMAIHTHGLAFIRMFFFLLMMFEMAERYHDHYGCPSLFFLLVSLPILALPFPVLVLLGLFPFFPLVLVLILFFLITVVVIVIVVILILLVYNFGDRYFVL